MGQPSADFVERQLERLCTERDLPWDDFRAACNRLFGTLPERYAPFFHGMLNRRREALLPGDGPFLRGVAELLVGDFDAACRSLGTAAAAEEGETEAELALGLLHLVAGDHAQAADVLGSASDWDAREEPEHYALHLAASWALQASGRPTEALRAADRALWLDMTSAEALAAKAEALEALGERERAVRCLRSSIYHDPSLASARSRLQAIAPCESAEPWEPSEAARAALDELARAFRRTGNPDPRAIDGAVVDMIARIARYVEARDLDPALAAAHLDTLLFCEVSAKTCE